MAEFRYTGVDPEGKRQRGVLEASNSAEAQSVLESRGLHVTNLDETFQLRSKLAAWKARLMPVNLTELALTTRQFAVLMNSGVGVSRTLEVLTQQTLTDRLRHAWDDLASSLQKGVALSRGMARHPDVFDGLYRGLVKAGEASGTLVGNLGMLADLLEREVKLRQKLSAALTYPAFVLVICFAATFYLTHEVLPSLINGVFRESGMTLPWMTQVVVAFTDFINNRVFWVVIFPGLLLGAYLLLAYSRTAGGRYRVQLLAFHTPVLRMVFIKAACARFARTMGCLVGCGVPLAHCLQLTDMVLSNYVLSQYIVKMKTGLEEGESLSTMIRQVPFFPPLLAAFTELGEQTGHLPQLYARLANMFDEELEVAIDTATTLIEPMLVGVLGLVVGFIVVAMLLPMYQLLYAL